MKDAELMEFAAKMKSDQTRKEMKDKVNEIIFKNLKKRGGAPV